MELQSIQISVFLKKRRDTSFWSEQNSCFFKNTFYKRRKLLPAQEEKQLPEASVHTTIYSQLACS